MLSGPTLGSLAPGASGVLRDLVQWFSECDLWSCCLSITCDPVQDAHSWWEPDLLDQELGGPSNLYFDSPPRRADARLKFENRRSGAPVLGLDPTSPGLSPLLFALVISDCNFHL